MVKYYPLTRIKTDLYTQGNEFLLPDGKYYSGKYYVTYDGKAFTGANPTVGTNQLLVVARQNSPATSLVNTPAVDIRAITTSDVNRTGITELKQLRSYYPIPLESDYTRGYFTRYFAKQLTGINVIVEVSETDWANINNGLTQQDYVAYEVTSMLWQLTGPRNDQRISQYQIRGGVYDTNKRVTEGKNKTFSGLVEFIGEEYTKFARIA